MSEGGRRRSLPGQRHCSISERILTGRIPHTRNVHLKEEFFQGNTDSEKTGPENRNTHRSGVYLAPSGDRKCKQST